MAILSEITKEKDKSGGAFVTLYAIPSIFHILNEKWSNPIDQVQDPTDHKLCMFFTDGLRVIICKFVSSVDSTTGDKKSLKR